MTLKYESELLFDLMKRDGDVAPSDVLAYESELKEKYLNQVVGAYPKLQDYQPEWLYYNLYHHLPSDFPVELVANVTSASFENVVPYAYKSAILKGQTMVNLINNKNASGSSYIENDLKLVYELPVGKYILFYDVIKANTSSGQGVSDRHTPMVVFNDNTKIHQGYEGLNQTTGKKYWIIKATKPIIAVKYWFSNLVEEGEVDNLRLFVYQDGMENWDIPFFTGMKSVKMPVLTTSNEDGTKSNILTCNEDVTLRGIGDVRDELDLLTGQLTQRIDEIVLDGSESWGEYASQELTNTRLFYCEVPTNSNINTSKFTMINNRFASLNPNNEGLWNTDVVGLGHGVVNNAFRLRVLKSTANTINELKEYLHSNPIVVQYELAEKSIKTVDLSCINEQGESATFRPIEGTMHVNTSSQALPPLLDMSVPVEATTQNLMSFANIEEEE